LFWKFASVRKPLFWKVMFIEGATWSKLMEKIKVWIWNKNLFWKFTSIRKPLFWKVVFIEGTTWSKLGEEKKRSKLIHKIMIVRKEKGKQAKIKHMKKILQRMIGFWNGNQTKITRGRKQKTLNWSTRS
jgi:hypothetical protein